MDILHFGAIDIGSNAIRLLVMSAIEYAEGVKYKKVTLVRIPIRLGADVFVNEKISEDKVQQLLEAMRGFKFILNAYRVDDYRACATSATREARNGKDLLNRIKEIGINLEIISGQEEANIIFNTGIAQLINKNKDYLYVDVGGGSTEVTVVKNGEKFGQESFRIGTVRMLNNKTPKEEIARFKEFMRMQSARLKDASLIGSGGNINTLFKLMGKKQREFISPGELKQIFKDLSGLTFDERVENYRMHPHRADVIIPATKIFNWALKYSNAQRVFVPKMGLVDGIVKQLYSKYKENKIK